MEETIETAYEYAITGAVRETGLAPETFPTTCPWPFATFMDEAFWPESATS